MQQPTSDDVHDRIPDDLHEASLGEVAKQLTQDISTLLKQEVALAKAEVNTALNHIKAGVLSLAIGLGVLFAGFIVLLFAAAAALSLVVAPWLAYLIVGGAVAIIGLILLMVAKKNLNPESMVPNRTIDSLKKDEEMVRRTVS